VTVPLAIADGVSGRIADAVVGLGVAAETVRRHGPWTGALLVLAGAAALTLSARSRHGLAVLGGAALGALAALAARSWIAAHVGLSPGAAAAIGAAAGAAAGGAWPGAFPFAAGAVPGAILGAGVPLSGRAILGAAAGAAVGGVVGLAAGRATVTALASIAGGALVAVGGVALLGGRPIAAELAARPFALAAVAIVLGIAGAAYQISRGAGSPPRGQPPRPQETRDRV
jgi:hypothetical protein